MPGKDLTFELSGCEITLPCEWDYSYSPGRYHGLPENCFPEEEDSEINPPQNLEEMIATFARQVMVPMWIKEIESQCSDMEFDGMPREWAGEYEDDRY